MGKIVIDTPNDFAEAWKGKFGNAYTERNKVQFMSRLKAIKDMTKDLEFDSCLELGCNKGHNLKAIKSLYPDRSCIGLEINRKSIALDEYSGIYECNITKNIPFRYNTFDLVFTAGVLIHVPAEHLEELMLNMLRLSRRYIMAIEYYGTDEEIEYREFGTNHGLWKRDFSARFMKLDDRLKLIKDIDLNYEEGFDRCKGVILELC